MILALVVALAAQGPAGEPPRSGEPAGRERIDAVAAVVERRVITTSEVEAEARLVLLERAGADVAAGALDEALLARVLDAVVVQELLALEARRAGIVVREVDIDKSVDDVRARFDASSVPGALVAGDTGRAFLARFGIDEELLRGRARRDLAAAALLGRTFAEVKVTVDEARALLDERPHLGDVAAARATLEKERREQAFAKLVDEIRGSTEVRVVWRP